MSVPSTLTQISQSFGFHTESSFQMKNVQSVYTWSSELSNRKAWGGAIPLIGNLLGVLRIKEAKEAYQSPGNKEIKAFLVTQIVRGVLETIGLGILLLLVDLIVTAGRYIADRCACTSENSRSYSTYSYDMRTL